MNASTLTPDGFMTQQKGASLTPDSFMAQPDQQGQSAPQGLGADIVDWLHKTFAPRSAMDMPGAKAPTGEMPGSFEGHPENIGEYVPASAGEVAGGAKDIYHGDIAKGAHRIISGVGAGVAPMLPFAAAAAPAQFATTMATGAVGQEVGKEGAKVLGATDDLADLAGDVGGIASGYGASKLPAGRVAGVVGKLAKGTMEDIPGVRQAGKISQYWKETQPTGTPLVYDTPQGPEPQPEGKPLVYKEPVGPPDPTQAQLKPALYSPARTLPGQIPPEVVKPPTQATAAPIPPREGLALPPAPKGAELTELPSPSAKPASQTGEALGQPVKRGSIAQAVKTPETTPAAQQSGAPPPPPPQTISRGSIKQMMDAMQSQLTERQMGAIAKKLDPSLQGDPYANLPHKMTPVDSSAISKIGYDPSSQSMAVEWKNGTVYEHPNVPPEAYDAFANAESQGKHFSANMRGQYPGTLKGFAKKTGRAR